MSLLVSVHPLKPLWKCQLRDLSVSLAAVSPVPRIVPGMEPTLVKYL